MTCCSVQSGSQAPAVLTQPLAQNLRPVEQWQVAAASCSQVLSQRGFVTANDLAEVCTFVPNTWAQILELASLLCIRTSLASVFAMRITILRG